MKDFHATGNLQVDTSFMTSADVPSLSAAGLIENPVNPFTGNRITMEPKKNGVYVADSHLWSPDGQYKNAFKISDDEWYLVKDDIFSVSNWTQEVPQ